MPANRNRRYQETFVLRDQHRIYVRDHNRRRSSHSSCFEFARKRAEQFVGVTPVKSALFSDDWVGFGIASLYESLMKQTPIEAQAFRDRATAAVWLDVSAGILKLEDKPGPPH
jgi:hypothetical protein